MMNLDEIKTAIHSHNKGSFTTIETCKTLKTKKAYADKSIVKVSRMTGRFGVDYNHISKVQQKRESGELPKEPQRLPYGHWIPGWEGYLIEYNGMIYLRVATSPNKTKSTYIINGVVSTEENAKKLCLASEFSKNRPDVINIKVENIVSI